MTQTPFDKKTWIEAHDHLKALMQKEIHIMREILANMHQEELCLLLNDKGSWNQVMQERSTLIERLSSLRSDRITMTEKIEHMASLKTDTKSPSLEQILPAEDDATCEILSLRDQLMALIERMNTQNSRNEYLFHHVEYMPPLSLPSEPVFPSKAAERPKRKAAIATYHIKK